MNEVWKSIPGFKDYYQVSNTGKFRSLGTPYVTRYKTNAVKKPMVFKCQSHESNGYIQVLLVNRAELLHRLVALAFIPKPPGKDFINHKNGIKDDNRVENLEWCTRSENCKHSFVIGTQDNKGELHPCHKITAQTVIEIRGKYVPRIYPSRRLGREYGLTHNQILNIVSKKAWPHI